MKKLCLGCCRVLALCVLCFVSVFVSVECQSCSPDASVMLALRDSLNHSSSLGWDDSDPCKWNQHISWSNGKRVIRIQIGNLGLGGSLPSNLNSLTELEVFEVQKNRLSGPLPSFAGLKSLQRILLSNNQFSSIPSNFFDGLSSLQEVFLDYNPFSPWSIPDSLRGASKLDNFSATSANIFGTIPDFFGGDNMQKLGTLHLAFNNLEGGLPESFAGSAIESLWLNGQGSSSKLNGTISVLQNMTHLTQVWLHGNSFSGPLPDFSGVKDLQWLSLRDNQLTGPVPASLVEHPSLRLLNLTKNMLQGPRPKFHPWVAVDMSDGNSFCSSGPGERCDERVTTMLLIAQSVGYPLAFSEDWKGNDPCKWSEIRCDNANIVAINFQKMGLTGTISPYFSNITSLQTLDLSDNNFTGTIPIELTNLPNLSKLDVSNNQIHGKISFRSSVIFKTDGNPDWGKDVVVIPSPGTPAERTPGSPLGTNNSDNKSYTKTIVGLVIGGVSVVFVVGIGIFCIYRSKQLRLGRKQQHPNGVVIHPSQSGLVQGASKISFADFGVSGGLINEHYSGLSRKGSNIRMGDSGSTLIPIHLLRCLTNNFSEANILGRGGFGTVYRGVMHDGTKIAVKRMESGVVGDKALAEFNTEFKALLSVRNRHLVALIGYCLDENERLLVFEYMSQGTLTSHLFNWKEERLKPLDWKKWVTIALDVARGVEYLHSLAHQSFIHRDLKPSNILLGDDMRAKVADFGLVRSFPDGQASIATKLAGTFGYLAPEYAATGRVTTKVDVYSFGVILMELITGRKALDKSLNEECLVSWFRRMYNNKETFREAIDSMIDPDEETLASISTVAKLAGHCCAREPCQRPEMSHAVNVLSSLTDYWNPSELDSEDYCITKSAMNLPEAVKWWQDLDGNNFPIDTVSSSNTGSSYFTKSRNV